MNFTERQLTYVLALAVATTLVVTLNVIDTQYPSLSAFAQQNTTKPVDGYNKPDGHVNAIRHIFDDPALKSRAFL